MAPAWRQLWPTLFLLPGLAALLVALFAPMGQSAFWAWCAAYWWQLLFFGALGYFASTFVRWVFLRRRRHALRSDA